MENTGDLVLYDGSGNVQWYQGEKYYLVKKTPLKMKKTFLFSKNSNIRLLYCLYWLL